MSAGLLCHALNRLPSRFSERLFGVFKRKSPDGKAAKLFHSIINDRQKIDSVLFTTPASIGRGFWRAQLRWR